MNTQTFILSPAPVARKHKIRGIASLVAGVISAAAVGIVMAIIDGIKIVPETWDLATIMSMVLLVAGVFVLIGLGLGISGVVDRCSKKAFPVLGLTLNAAIVAFYVTLVVIGLRN
jgi:hypothetical protein